MKIAEWSDVHPDVRALMSTNHKDLTMKFMLKDISDHSIKAEREMPFQSLPLEQDELVVEDYICSIFEQLYQGIKESRDERSK